MKTIAEKRISIKKNALIIMLAISTLCVQAGQATKFKNLITKEFGSLTGIYIMVGVIIAGLGIYFISSYYTKKNEKLEKSKPKTTPPPNNQATQRRAQRRVIRKTS